MTLLPLPEFFDLLDRAHYARSDMEDTLSDIFGLSDAEFHFDSYDCSFEILNLEYLEWAPTSKQLSAAFALGFAHCWMNYQDRTERHCYPGLFGGVVGDKHMKTGGLQ